MVYTVLSLPPECILSFLYLLCWEMVCILGKKMVEMRTPPAENNIEIQSEAPAGDIWLVSVTAA